MLGRKAATSELVGDAVWINGTQQGRGGRCWERCSVSIQRLASSDRASEQRDRVSLSRQLGYPKQAAPHLPQGIQAFRHHRHLAVRLCVATGSSCSGTYTRDDQILFPMKNVLF